MYKSVVKYRVWGSDQYQVYYESPLCKTYSEAEDLAYDNRDHYKDLIEVLEVDFLNEGSPSEVKKRIHRRYDEKVRKVLAGEAGYVPCKKSPLSKSCSDKFPSVEFGVMCPTCKDTKEVENPLTGELHFCPICSEN